MHFLKTGPGLADLFRLFVWFLVGIFCLVLFFLTSHYLELGEQRTNVHVANMGAGGKRTKKPQQELFTNIYAEVQRKERERLKIRPARKQESVQ